MAPSARERELRPAQGGLIFRTVSEHKELEHFREDVEFLTELWGEIQEMSQKTKSPALIHHDLDLILRSIRDLLTPRCHWVMIDSPRDYQRILSFISRFMPHWNGAVELYDGQETLFERYGANVDIQRALDRKVWLKSGGYIIIDETEALTA